MTAVPDPYDRDVYNGRLMDFASIAATMKAEHELGYRLTILQGVGGAPASSGTHMGRKAAGGKMEGGRAIDFAFWDHQRKMAVWRKLLGPFWPRLMLPGVWEEHCHALTVFIDWTNQRGIAPAAFDQLGKYLRGEDGLSGSTPDPNPGRPTPRPMLTIDEYRFIIGGGLEAPPENNVTRMRDSLVEAIQDVSKAIAFAGKTPEEREKVHAEIDYFKKVRRGLNKRLDEMPPR